VDTEQLLMAGRRASRELRYGSAFVPRIIKRANGKLRLRPKTERNPGLHSGQIELILGHSHQVGSSRRWTTRLETLDICTAECSASQWWNLREG